MTTYQNWQNNETLIKDLQAVEEMINQHIRIKNKQIEAQIKQVTNNHGKMLRPLFVILTSKMGNKYDHNKTIALAAAMETLHMATLIHDDVIDQADTRRQIPTLHTVKDNRYAIYAGDYLFSICFNMLSKYTEEFDILNYNARTMEKVLIGELDQLEARFTPPKSVKRYLSRISGKTAQLFAVSCYIGATESGASLRDRQRAYNMGKYIGMAFQIIDDILDFKGDEKNVGKPVMADIRQGIFTLPLIYSYQQQPDAVSALLKRPKPYTDETIHALEQQIIQTEALDAAQRLAERYTHKALATLSKLPEGSYKAMLGQIISDMLERTL
ncbi:geranylgeranyl pyrophosphate synthase [Halolactibacillus alkaliphilus]|uniref:Geranylgeranyl pyrophosphate synthase n=1 Tax=Halolactibacillus alkaliphilus TaxID=442899 RepID=A0A511X4I4_9BACI|nr:polyprenyl synthetase family protein [Halolactibacillus alkaliphilus]GEN57857.1 geranylgeranyl pyrophosphate synthase [Halolactibacillus alkaliphilus]GGN75566.1 geranylgeranyl pyrophosphate synthase [Halolactibacillus alkaliphilus]SFP06773.1 heptaprenyl diphosphate synthase [Halolactibacillus alkaliphilus]